MDNRLRALQLWDAGNAAAMRLEGLYGANVLLGCSIDHDVLEQLAEVAGVPLESTLVLPGDETEAPHVIASVNWTVRGVRISGQCSRAATPGDVGRMPVHLSRLGTAGSDEHARKALVGE